MEGQTSLKDKAITVSGRMGSSLPAPPGLHTHTARITVGPVGPGLGGVGAGA